MRRTKLSRLEKGILREGLVAFYLSLVHRTRTPGSFGIRRILEDHFGIPLSIVNRWYSRSRWAREDNREAQQRQAAPRASISRACVRLARRGLLEKLGRSRWRLTNEGIDVSRELFGELEERMESETAARAELATLERQLRAFRRHSREANGERELAARILLPDKELKTKRPGVQVELVILDAGLESANSLLSV
jgi:hypothetical protein